MKKIGFIGTGNLACAILKGVIESKLAAPEDVYIYDINGEKTNSLKALYGVNVLAGECETAAQCDAVLCAVKPKDMTALLTKIAPQVRENSTLVISTAAGFELAAVSSALGESARAVRIMPNINASSASSMTAYCACASVTAQDVEFVEKFCSAFGKVISLEERLFSAFTAVAGSAPAFVYDFIDSLAFSAVKHGIPRQAALEIAAQTVLGSAKTVLESELHPRELVDRVCSPGGTTVEGVAALDKAGFADAVISAVDATVKKDIEMKKQVKA